MGLMIIVSLSGACPDALKGSAYVLAAKFAAAVFDCVMLSGQNADEQSL
jgi:hypothetical protein